MDQQKYIIPEIPYIMFLNTTIIYIYIKTLISYDNISITHTNSMQNKMNLQVLQLIKNKQVHGAKAKKELKLQTTN